MTIKLPPNLNVANDDGRASFDFETIFQRLVAAVNAVSFNGFPRAQSFPKADLPSAATASAGALVYVTDEAGGPVIAFSDGTSWRRVTDRAVVS